jgi:hypothetical protein
MFDKKIKIKDLNSGKWIIISDSRQTSDFAGMSG